jgi:hypothetical protein
MFDDLKNNRSVDTAIDLGFFDWWCRDEALMGKIRRLAPLVKALAKSGKVNPDKVHVFFKNNCPMRGPLYDSISVVDIDTDKVILWMTPKSGHTGLAELVDFRKSSKEVPGIYTVKDLKNYFKAA